jgi:uncharacterized membrane-anchored protein YitT (DUF2179 family)
MTCRFFIVFICFAVKKFGKSFFAASTFAGVSFEVEFGRVTVVADFAVERPHLFVNASHVKLEAGDAEAASVATVTHERFLLFMDLQLI